jgi:uncharacterized protein YkwD
MRRPLLSALVVVLALALAPLAGGTTRTSAQRASSLEQGILREVNRVRVSRGLRPLTVSPELQNAASFQTRALLAQGVFDHDTATSGAFSDRLRRFYPVRAARSWSVGENLLWSSAGIDASDAVKLWLESPPHRKILLDANWREFGIGAFTADGAPGVFASAGAVVVVTLDFGLRTTRAVSSSGG